MRAMVRRRTCRITRNLIVGSFIGFTLLRPAVADDLLAGEYLTDGNFKLAIEEYTKSIAEKPNWAEPYVNRGAAYLSAGELDKALKDESHAIKLLANGKDNALLSIAYSNRGVIEEKLNRKADALKDAEKALKLDGNNAKAQEYILKSRKWKPEK